MPVDLCLIDTPYVLSKQTDAKGGERKYPCRHIHILQQQYQQARDRRDFAWTGKQDGSRSACNDALSSSL
jgi:hypothetical protein